MRLSGQEYVDMYASRAKEEQKRLDREGSRDVVGRPAEETELKAS
jgi:hypothetical protein